MARAQEATPKAEEANLLFVHVGWETTITPNGDGTVTITMTGIASQTQYFTDRPVPKAGVFPTAEFTEKFAATFADGLPNASLVGMVAGQDSEMAMVLEIDQPTHDPAAEAMSYVARVLTEDLIEGRTFETDVIAQITEPITLSEAALFIDSVPTTLSVNCTTSICL